MSAVAGISPAELERIAVEIALKAGALARERRAAGVSLAATKSTIADIVTEADREVEELVRARLAVIRPDDGFLGEEGGAGESASGITWVVDPIDGTVNYAYGNPMYAVSIAAVQGEPHPEAWTALAGVVYSPVQGEMFRASRGGGAWLGDERLAVNTDFPAGALLGTGFGYDPATHDPDLAAVRRVMPLARDLRRSGSAATDLAYVAAGRLDAYFERGLSAWDFAAGALLVSEAGGVLRRYDTGSKRPLVVAATQTLHDQIAQLHVGEN